MVGRKRWVDASVALVLIVCIAGCSIGNLAFRRSGRPTPKELAKSISPMIESQKGVIGPYLDIDLDIDGYSGEEIVAKALGEEKGREYLEFCYELNHATRVGTDPRTVVEKARGLLPEAEFEDLKEKADEASANIRSKGLEMAKGLPPDQREAFTRDLESLVVKTIVLLTAGIVYACMPTVMLWGKVAAAAGISIAAGAVAVTVLSIYEYYQFGSNPEASFKDWLKKVIAVPQAEYAIATSVIATATALNQGPVVSGIVLCVFAIFHAIDMLRPMLQIYNFDI